MSSQLDEIGAGAGQTRGGLRAWIGRALTNNGLDQLYRHAGTPLTMNFDPGADKLVCVSDLHRGARDGSDDFRRSERVYNAALRWYADSGYHLAVLGDAEELWECSPEEVLGCTDRASLDGYARSLALERRFNDAGRYLRIYGNHDRLWTSRHAVRRWLEPHVGEVDVRGAVTIEVAGDCGDIGAPRPLIMLTHGDAGALESSLLAPISKVFVHFWAFWQKRIGALTGMPADDWDLRDGLDVTMYEWACRQDPRVLLITGHTHRPVFPTSSSPPPPTPEDVARLEQAVDHASGTPEEDAAGEFEIAELRRQAKLRAVVDQTHPCYFNDGACCFGDGQITSIEIAGGEIRLVRWGWHEEQGEHGDVRAHVLDRKPLRAVLAQIRAPEGAEPNPPKPPPPGRPVVEHEDGLHEHVTSRRQSDANLKRRRATLGSSHRRLARGAARDGPPARGD